MLDLDEMREEFSRHLAANTDQRWRLDASLAHVVTLAYRRGMEESPAMSLARDILDPEMYGHAVTEEVRDAARRVVMNAGIER